MLKKIAFFLLLVMIFIVGAYFSLAAKYKYNVAQDYEYAIENSQHTEIKVELNQGQFQFKNTGNWDTGFLRIKLKSTLIGYFAEPFIEIISDNKVSVLTVERGADGVRYINLPVFNARDLVRVKLVAHYLTIEDQQASAILFNNASVHQQPKILIISPHPDDAEIAAFGLYSQHNSMIVTVTAGEAGPHTYDEVYSDVEKHYQMKGKLRVWNSITVPMLGGIKPEYAINLGYFDGTLEKMYKNKHTPINSLYSGVSDINYFRQQNISTQIPKLKNSQATWKGLVSDIKQVLLKFKPDIIVTPYPKIDWHFDHKLATIAVIEAIKELKLKKGKLFLYTNHFNFNNYFPYGNQGELVPIPPDLNKTLYFDSIYSFTPEQPKDKIFALDAMNDLRLDTSWLSTKGGFKVFKDSFVNNVFLREQSYFRRAVRENELFLVVDFLSLYVSPSKVTKLK